MKFRFFIISLVIIGLIGCSADGSAYQKYWWTGSLQRIYDENPSTPATIYNNVNFPTESGTFYMEYTAWDNSSWWLYYTISINKGDSMLANEADKYFEILLLSTGPAIYVTEKALSISGLESNEKLSLVTTPLSTGKTKSGPLSVISKDYPYGEISIVYGEIE